jgi:hypothetical protein
LQVALLHNRDLFGTGYADAFVTAARNHSILYQTISLGAIITPESMQNAMSILKESGFKVSKNGRAPRFFLLMRI